MCDTEYACARAHTHTHTYIYILYSPLTPRKYTVLKGNFVFDMHDVFQEGNPGIQRDLPVFYEHEKNVCSCCFMGRKNLHVGMAV